MISISFNKKVYRKDCVLRAIDDYAYIANISFSEHDGYYICNFSNTKYDLEVTKKEFTNYLIELQNSRSI